MPAPYKRVIHGDWVALEEIILDLYRILNVDTTLADILTPPGSDGEIIYNNDGVYGADSTFSLNDVTKMVTVKDLTITTVAASVVDTDKFLVDDSNVVKFRTGAELLSDIGGSASGHLHDGDTLQHDGVNSDGGAFSFTTSGAVTFSQDILTTGATVTNCAVLGSDSAVFQPNADSTTFFQILDANGGTPIFSVNSTAERVGIGVADPEAALEINSGSFPAFLLERRSSTAGIASSFVLRTRRSGVGVEGFGGSFLFELLASNVGAPNFAGRLTCYMGPTVSKGELAFSAGDDEEFLRIDEDGQFGFGETSPETFFELTHATPYITLHNSTHEDSDGGRESRFNFKGEQSGGEETTLARIEVGHDGAADDQKGYLDEFINDGDDGDTPTKVRRVDSLGTVFETGPIFLKETTTPAARTNYAAIYATSDNELFWQDGAGTEHLLHGDAFSEIWFHGASTVEVTISTQNVFTIVDSFTVVGHEDDLLNVVGSSANNNLTLSSIGGGEYEVSYHGSVTATGGADKEMIFVFGITLATPKDITDVTDNTITPIVITSAGHGLEDGDMVEIEGVVGNTAANGSFIVDNKTTNTFEIVDLAGGATTGNGDYNEGSPTGDITILYPGNMVVHRMVRGADLGAMSATGIHILAANDVLALYVANVSGTTNLTVAAVNFDVNRIGD